MPVASLSPRLCPAYPLVAIDETVLVRLSSNAPDEFEYVVDAVEEAFEGCRFVGEEYSAVGVGRRVWRYDITTSESGIE